MCTALDVSKYILKYCKDNNVKDCSNKKLQKLLYYVQAWSAAFRNKKIFQDEIKAWLHGPVIPTVYHAYKDSGFNPIDTSKVVVSKCLSDDEKNLIDMVLKGYTKYDADYLEMRTHIEEPWQEARKIEDKIIKFTSMRKYYKNIADNAAK